MVSKSSILKLPWERYKGKTSLNRKRGSEQQKQGFFLPDSYFGETKSLLLKPSV